MVSSRYLASFAVAAAVLMSVFLGVTLLVDPYGVSPLAFARKHLNLYKPARVDIDRFIKPFEVWKYQPRTVFLGSSRIQQGIDPAIMSQSRFAPAYNASVPASSVPLNVSYLRQYIGLNPNLRTVILELFFYQFVRLNIDRQGVTGQGLWSDAGRLFLSRDALWASIKTIEHNVLRDIPVYEIRPGGFFYYPPGHNSEGGFDGFATGIWKLHELHPVVKLDDDAFSSFHDFTQICRDNNIELILLLTPNHAYDDYYIDQIGAWDTMEEWLRRVAMDGSIESFSQPNEWVDEPVAPRMIYWNDPYHFTLEMGRGIQTALVGGSVENAPANFAMKLTPDNISGHVEMRKLAVRKWAEAHPDFTRKFEEERRKWEASR